MLREVVIPESVERISVSAFQECKNLEKVEIPRSVERIGYHAFYNCCKATIILKKPRREISIGSGAFSRCKDVKEEIRC